MPKKLLESAFIDLIDINSDEFQQRKYFFYRYAIHIEKEIGLTKGVRMVNLITFENRQAILPVLATNVKAVFPGNIFSLTGDIPKPYSLYRETSYTKPLSMRFAEQDNILVISRDETICTIVYDQIEENVFGQAIVEETHIPAITNYIKYRIVEKERLNCALKAGGNYYQLRSEAEEQKREYSLAIINARAVERFNETEKVLESNDIIISDGDFIFSE